jgi:hypothetical protein
MNKQTAFVIEKLSSPDIKTVLNIGYRFDSDTTIQKFVENNGKKFYALEVWKENCDQLIAKGVCKNIYCCDCRNIDSIKKNFDAIIWLHGPEHIKWEEFLIAREKIENKAKKLVIYQAPIGNYPQGAIYNNPFECHVETLYPNMFSELGYQIKMHNTGGEFTFSAYLEKK